MDEISSSEFRKQYASLREPTVVTVSGRPIGTWVPATITAFTLNQQTTSPGEVERDETYTRFNTRPFKPVPKGK